MKLKLTLDRDNIIKYGVYKFCQELEEQVLAQLFDSNKSIRKNAEHMRVPRSWLTARLKEKTLK